MSVAFGNGNKPGESKTVKSNGKKDAGETAKK